MPHRTQRTEIESQVLTLDGGISYLDQSRVGPTQHVAGRNWFLDRDGVVRPRPGNKIWNTASLGGDFQGLWEYRRQADGINALMAYCAGSLFRGDDTSQAFTALKTSLSQTARGFAFTAQDKFWWCNGSDIPQVYDSSNLFRIGVVNPAAAPTVALVAVAGNLPIEDHFYRYTYVREEVGIKVKESNPSAESAKVTPVAGSQQIDVTVTASTDAQVTHIYIYRRSVTSVGEDKFVAKVTNTTQTYRDNIAVASLGGFAFWETSGGVEDHGYPPVDIFSIVQHRDGRVYAWSKKSRLLYTRRFAFNYWPGASAVSAGLLLNAFQIIVNEDDGDEGMAVISEGDDLWLLKREHVYRLLGDGPDQDEGDLGTWKIEQIPTKYACGAKASAATGPAGTFWLSDEGMVVRVDERSGIPRAIGLEILPRVRTSTDRTKAVGWVHDIWYFLFFPVAGGKWEGHVWCLLNRSWWPVQDMDAQAFVTREGGKLFWGGVLERDKPLNGIAYEWDGQISDNGTAVTAELTTRVIDDALSRWKWYPRAEIYVEGRPGAILIGRLIPDQTSSYVERELKLNGITGSRLVKHFSGTKRLQGNVIQLFLRSANVATRPALYGWKRYVHTFNRQVPQVAQFTEAFLDPDPTIGIAEDAFAAGTHTQTEVVAGNVQLQQDTAWTLAFDSPYTHAGSLQVFLGKLVLTVYDSAADDLYIHHFDGTTWQTVLVASIHRIAATIPGILQATRILFARGNTLFAAPSWDTVTKTKIRKSTDLSTWSDHSVQTFFNPGFVEHSGLLWQIEHNSGGGVEVAWDNGGGSFTFIPDPGGNTNYARGDSFEGLLYTPDGFDLRAWNGSAWVTKGGLLPSVPASCRRFSVVNKLYIGTETGKIVEWSGTALTTRLDAVLGIGQYVSALEELVEPDGRKALYAGVRDTVFRSYDGITWINMQTPVAGQHIFGFAVYKGRRYVGLQNGDVWSTLFYKTTGTYRLDERDLLSTRTQAQVAITETVPTATTLRTRLGYANVAGGPYTFTAWETRTAYLAAINGRFLVLEADMTSDGGNTPKLDRVEILAR